MATYVKVEPEKSHGNGLLNETLIPAHTIAGLIWEGYSAEDISFLFPNLDLDGILTSCWFQARYGEYVWHKRWGYWAKLYENGRTTQLPYNQKERISSAADGIVEISHSLINFKNSFSDIPTEITGITILRKNVKKVKNGDPWFWMHLVKNNAKHAFTGDPF
jgi:uncharacterized protein (DUF433 family)